MEINTLENWLWDAACSIRGPIDAPKYKDYILPLLFYKRLSDVYEDELTKLGEELGDERLARELAQEDRQLVRVFIPPGYTWEEMRSSPVELGQRLTDAMRAIATENSKLDGVINVVDFNATTRGQRILEDVSLARLMEILNRHRLGLENVEPDILGRAYEYLLRKFAEGSGQAAGEFYTPREVGILMAHILDPEEGEEIYDPTCGSGGLLIKAQLRLREKVAERLGKEARDLRPSDIRRPLQLFGQEILPGTYAMARMNAFIHDMEAEIALGDTMKAPRFTEDGRLRQFDKVTANPMWNQREYKDAMEQDTYGRFTRGVPPNSSADWGWIQHMLASLRDGGRLTIVLDTSAVSRGSGSRANNREKNIRAQIVENGLVDSVILLPENLFYNTGAPGIIIVCGKTHRPEKPIRLVNASRLFSKGSPKNYIADEHIKMILQAVQSDHDIEGLCRIIELETIRDLDYDLSPSRHVPVDPDIPAVPLSEALELERTSSKVVAETVGRRIQVYASMTGHPLAQDHRLPKGWVSRPLEEIITDNIGGDWGAQTPEDLAEFVRCQVIRGTDFPGVSRGKLASVPYRYIARKSFEKRKLQPEDILVEISGGGKYQNTGRVIYIDGALLQSASLPLLHTNFTRLLRIERSIVLPKYAFYAWKRLYELGRTARYEKQPTNIKNFKYKDFLAHEHVVYPVNLDEQARIAEALDVLYEEIRSYEKHLLILESLWHAAMTDFLSVGEMTSNEGGRHA
jgi:type I restriction enzyme M protein